MYIAKYIANKVIYQTLTNLSLFNYGALFNDGPHKMCDQMKFTSQPKIVVSLIRS